MLAQDNRNVLVRLNEKYTKTFVEPTKKAQGQILFLQCTDTAKGGMHITAPIEDGYMHHLNSPIQNRSRKHAATAAHRGCSESMHNNRIKADT